MHYTDQIKFSKKDSLSFLFPKLEKKILKQEQEIKRKNNWIIKVGCIISLFSLKFGYDLTQIYFPLEKEQLRPIGFSSNLFLLFSSLISGFLIDVITIKSTWFFVVIANICFQMILLASVFLDNYQISLIARFAVSFLLPLYVINFICILFEAICDVRDRLNNFLQFELIGEIISLNIIYCLDYILSEYNITREQNKDIYRYILICGIIFCQLLNLISLVILFKTYVLIEKIKIQSIKYQRFLFLQGVGFSLIKIYKYIRNKDFYYLFALTALCGFLAGINKHQEKQTSKLYLFCVYFSIFIVGLLLMILIKQNKRLVNYCYKINSVCIYLLLISIIYQFVSLLVSQYSDNNCLICNFISQIILQNAWIILYCFIHYIPIFLLPQKSSIRATILSIQGVIYFTQILISILLNSYELLLRSSQLLFILFWVIVHYKYQKDISFDKLEQKLVRQNHLK